MKNVSLNVDTRKNSSNDYTDYSRDPRIDLGLNGTDSNDQRFATHRFHSGEFDRTIMEQSKFWREVLLQIITTTQAAVKLKNTRNDAMKSNLFSR